MTQRKGKHVSMSTKYKFRNRVIESHSQPIYSVRFNLVDEELSSYFATVASNRATVYRILDDGAVEVVQVYNDKNKTEVFYTCTWSIDVDTGDPLLLCAGESALIKVINCRTQSLQAVLTGHGAAVNELQTSPKDCNILLSVSKDQSIRLWNINTCILIAAFFGEGGHMEEVLSCDFNLTADHFASSGMDHSIKIWSIDERLQQHIELSNSEKYRSQSRSGAELGEHSGLNISSSVRNAPIAPFKTLIVQFPEFSTDRIHSNYVDHVRYFGDFLLSKSVEEKIILWHPLPTHQLKLLYAPGRFERLQTYSLPNCDIWYVRFSLDWTKNLLAVGNKIGEVYVWDMVPERDASPCVLTHPDCNYSIRQLSFSNDSKWLIAGCDGASVWIWSKST